MDFDPNPPTGERNRSGPRWYSVVAFLVIALLLTANALAMFVNAEANEEQACYARAHAAAAIWGDVNMADGVNGLQYCDEKYGRGPWAEPSY